MRRLLVISLVAVSFAASSFDSSAVARREMMDRPRKAGKEAKAVQFEEIAKGIERLANIGSESEQDFAMGYASFKQGKWSDAEALLRRSYPGMKDVGDHVLYFRAVALNNIKRYRDAAQAAASIASDHPQSVWAAEAKYELARALAGEGKFSEVLPVISAYRPTASPENALDADKLYAFAMLHGGRASEAVEFIKSMMVHAGSEDEVESFMELSHDVKKETGIDLEAWISSPSQQLSLANSFYDHSAWKDAADVLEKLVRGGALSGDAEVDAKWTLARALKWLDRYDESAAMLEELRHDRRAKAFSNSLLGMLATVYAKKDDYAKAVEIRDEMMSRLFRKSAASANIAERVALLYVDEGRYEEAARRFTDILSMNCGKRSCAEAKWFLGWCYFKLGRFDDAVSQFDALLKGEAKAAKIADRVRYWKGVSLLTKGQSQEARSLFNETIDRNPDSYYAELARRRLDGKRPDGTADFAAMPFRGSGRSSWKPDMQAASSVSPYVRRAALLDRLEANDCARKELEAAEVAGNSDVLESIMWLASRSFAHDIAYRLAETRFRSVLDGMPGGDPFTHFIWESSYPEAYRPLVGYWASVAGVDPVLVWAIMRNESNFRPRVISPAGAVGLLQLMPTTAREAAGASGGKNFERRDLFVPAENIRFGTAYLKKLKGFFPDNPVAIVASYNAGEAAVMRWLSKGNMNDIEEWIEEIPYSETNLYVKRVLASYWNYKRLYRN